MDPEFDNEKEEMFFDGMDIIMNNNNLEKSIKMKRPIYQSQALKSNRDSKRETLKSSNGRESMMNKSKMGKIENMDLSPTS